MTTKTHRNVAEIASGMFIALFLYTGICKLLDYPLFKGQLSASPLLAPIAPYVAAILPSLEFFVAILLLIPRWRLKGLYATLWLLIVFTCYIIGVVTLDSRIPCSCGGAIEELNWTQHLVFNALLILLAIAAIRSEKRLRQEYKNNLTNIRSHYAS